MFEKREKAINKVVMISVDNIIPNPAQPRKEFVEDSLESLSKSIKENGILQPISVRRIATDKYEIIAGERRLRASKLAQLSKVPCIVTEVTPKQSAIFAVLENIQRADLNPIEQASALKQLIYEWNVTQEEASARLGIAQSTIANKLRILKLADKTKEILVSANLNERQARALLKITDANTQISVAEYIVAKGLNVAQTESYIESVILNSTKPTPKRKFVVRDVRLFINTINNAIKTMKQAGINASSRKVENDGYIEYTVKIPIAKTS